MNGRMDHSDFERPEPSDAPLKGDRRRNGAAMQGQARPDAVEARPKNRIIAKRKSLETLFSWAQADDRLVAEGMMGIVSGFLEGTLPPEFVGRLSSIKAGSARLDYQAITEFLWRIYEDRLPYSYDELKSRIYASVRDLRRRCRQEVEELDSRMNNFFKDIPALYERLHRLSLPAVGADGSGGLPGQLAPEVYAEILNVVRGAVGRILPREYGEGIEDVDVDVLEHLLLDFGTQLQSQWADRADSGGVVAEDLRKFLSALNDYDPSTPCSDFALLNSGARLLVELTRPDGFFGVFAKLNVYVTIDRLLPREQYLDVMQQLADEAEVLTHDHSVQAMVAGLNRQKPEGREGLPTARRLASYCLGNLVFTALDTSLIGGSPEKDRRSLIGRAKLAANVVALRDSSFEQNDWYKLASAAAESDLSGQDKLFDDVVKKLGTKRSFEILSRIRQQVNQVLIVDAIERRLLKLLGPIASNPAPSGSR